MIRKFLEFYPEIPNSCYIDDMSSIIGKVMLGEEVSVWPFASIRGEKEIEIGSYTNVQDNVVIHGDGDVKIGDYVSLGHSCVIHGCTIGSNVLIGMGVVVLDGSTIGDNCIVGAGSLITGGKTFEAGSLIIGSPAKAVRKLTQDEIDSVRENAVWYINTAKIYKEMCK